MEGETFFFLIIEESIAIKNQVNSSTVMVSFD